MNCTYLSRDFTLFFKNFNTNYKDLSATFANFIDKKYLTVHNYFMELNNLLQIQ
jgi:hypothetical protein